ncbi:MAG TPA: type I glutamate--ammonia ligase [Vicinamibacterales bacterium]|nr:type I glutamate--ammonia ligase [Vicinamibacterales bacterium]
MAAGRHPGGAATGRARHGARAAARKAQILELAEREKVKFLRLQFTDILGTIKNVEVPDRQFEQALSGEIMFDGSSIEGFVRIEESDMYLRPDLDTFQIFPWTNSTGEQVARIICDIYTPAGEPFAGCPRSTLKRAIARAADLGFTMNAGPEAEFFLFQTRNGAATTETHDAASYFDLTPVDMGEDVRREIVLALEAMGFYVEAAHHEVAAGQHEVDFRYDDALTTADNISTFRFVVKNVAIRNGLHATFMPKPIYGINGSGMHTHQSLLTDGANRFYDERGPGQLSEVCLHYIGGLLRHAKGFCAITNPLVNSYKRLVPGFEAPTNIAWSEKNRSPLVRVPAARGPATRIELRMPDPSCNPYLALAVMLRAGLDGIEQQIDPGPPVNKNIYRMSHRERRHLRIDELPSNLSDALDELEKDELVRDTLGEHIFEHFLEAKREEWLDYIKHVSPWEVERYLRLY